MIIFQKKTKFWAYGLILLSFVLETTCFVALRLISEPEKVEPQEMFEFHPILGKVLRPSFRGKSERTGEVVTYETDEMGRRQPKAFREGSCRLTILGTLLDKDSPNIEDTWFGLLKDEIPELAISNESVSGYGIDQVYLKYLESKFVAEEVLLYFGTIGGHRHYQRYMFGRPKPLLAYKENSFEIINDREKNSDGLLIDHLPPICKSLL